MSSIHPRTLSLVVFLVLAAAAAPPDLALYDLLYAYSLPPAAGYEEVQLVSALAGLANRFTPQLALSLEPADAVWLPLAFPGSQLSPVAPPVEGLVARFASSFRGAVLYDPAVFCTSAIANTAAGAEDLLPIAFRPADPTSLYSRLVTGGPRLPVVRSLVGLFNGSRTGSVKRDAYEWAFDTFIKTNLSDASHLNYYVDYYWTTVVTGAGLGAGTGSPPLHFSRAVSAGLNGEYEKATIPNLDYGVARRGFFFDLSVWADEAPVDEKAQPLGSDLAAFKYMLGAAYNATMGMITIHGFTPWAYKYVAPNGKHQGVETEWATVLVTSSFNTIVDADACCIGAMANAALFSTLPLAPRHVQRPPPSRAQLQQRGLLAADGSVVGKRMYFMFYAGDFDSAAWLYSQLLQRWQDPARGSVPIGWGVDPGLAARFPPIYAMLYATASANDTIISGDSGAGYINPTLLPDNAARRAESGLPSGLAPWSSLNSALYRQFGLTFTGFAISGDGPQPAAADEAVYANFSRDGLVNQGWPDLSAHLTADNLPVVTQWDISSDVPAAVAAIKSFVKPAQDAPTWIMFRSVLTSPTFLASVASAATIATGGAAVAVTPLELSCLMRVQLGGSLDNLVAYVADSLTASPVPSGSQLKFSVTVRNDGWNALPASGHGIVVAATRIQRLVKIGASDSRAAWVRRGLVALDAGEHATHGMRRELARGGLVGYPAASIGGPSTYFPLPADLLVGGSVDVPVSVELPALGLSAEGDAALVEIAYQLSEKGGKTFDAYGNQPWVATVLVD